MSLDLALVRWSVVCGLWETRAGNRPDLGAFLAGWFLRRQSENLPENWRFFGQRDSFLAGWSESETFLALEAREQEAEAG